MVKKTTKVSRPRRVAGNCMTCAKAHLMQWGNNPIISQCAASQRSYIRPKLERARGGGVTAIQLELFK